MTSPVLADCIRATGLPENKVIPALGLALRMLRERVDPALFAKITSAIPEVADWIEQAPARKQSLLGGLAASVGGDRAGMLLELSQGLSRIGIPTATQRPLADALVHSVETHHPELKIAFEHAFRG